MRGTEEAQSRGFAQWVKKWRKGQADRKFSQQYGGEPALEEPAGPRAALYKGEVGASQRKAQKLQRNGSQPQAFALGKKSSKAARSFSSKKIAALVVVGVLVFSACFLYGPARVYYQQIREQERLELEYRLVQERNDAIQDQIDALSTDEGIEDMVRESYGWAPTDEQSLSVAGLETNREASISGNVFANDIKPPDTWYSGLLDPLFGVK